MILRCGLGLGGGGEERIFEMLLSISIREDQQRGVGRAAGGGVMTRDFMDYSVGHDDEIYTYDFDVLWKGGFSQRTCLSAAMALMA